MLGSIKTVLTDAYEGSLRSILSSLINRKNVYMYVPETDSQALVQENIMYELDGMIKLFERHQFEVFKDNARRSSKVDYTWLISIPFKRYRMPPMERMEIETLAYGIKPVHTSYCIKLFRSNIHHKTSMIDIPGIMIQSLRSVLTEYEVIRYTSELSKGNILRKIRSESKVYPSTNVIEDTFVIVNTASVGLNTIV